MENQYTVTIFTENKIGLLNRITIIFTRRHLNIDSITASESEVPGIYRYTIVVQTSLEQIKKVVAQIEKLVEVIKAFYFLEEEVIHQEMALYKVSTKSLSNNTEIEKIIRENNARVLSIEDGYFVIEKTGYKRETQDLFNKLEPFGVLQFARSGRVAVTRQRKELTNYLKDLVKASESSDKIRNWKLNQAGQLN
ncbi:MAG: acetolactate synthase small subunit [Bacteroidales bacterium]|nr:acetolactate synthase small subunit [Bacteroidales bacterium]